MLEFVSGWLVHRRAPFNGIIDLTDSNVDPETVGELQLESRFLTSLQERLQAKVGTFKTHWMQMLAPCLKALTAAEEALYNCVYLLNAEHHSGYLKHVLREKISDQHDAILKQLHQQSQVVLPSVLAQFELDCNFLLVEQYGIAKQKALHNAVMGSAEDIEAILVEFDVEDLWGQTPLHDRENLLQSCLQ